MQWARYGHPLIHINVASNLELRILVVLIWERYRHPSAAGMLMAAPSDTTVPAAGTPASNSIAAMATLLRKRA